MADKNSSISEFIKKLKTIDIGDLLEKAQTLRVEDLRSLKWKDIYNSKLFFPTIGFILAISSTIFIFIPSYRRTSAIRIESKLYINESKQLGSLEKTLNKSLLKKDKLKAKLKNLTSFVINKKNLIEIPRLFNDSAKRSNVNLIEIRPISKDSISCLYSEQELDNKNFSRGNIGNDNSIKKDFFTQSNTSQDSKIDNSVPINFEQFKSSNKSLKNIFARDIQDIDPQFRSNFFLLKLESNYLNSVDFIKNLQEYKISIIPICFEPTGPLLNQNPQLSNKRGEAIKNKLNIRLIINVPTK